MPEQERAVPTPCEMPEPAEPAAVQDADCGCYTVGETYHPCIDHSGFKDQIACLQARIERLEGALREMLALALIGNNTPPTMSRALDRIAEQARAALEEE